MSRATQTPTKQETYQRDSFQPPEGAFSHFQNLISSPELQFLLGFASPPAFRTYFRLTAFGLAPDLDSSNKSRTAVYSGKSQKVRKGI